MNKFSKDIKFKYDWRKYQQRVLDELEEHLEDNHLHIIAPPGSGKTILGLEVVLRLNKPTLVFAPTIAIRNQWIQRFCELFLQVEQTPDWISRDIKNPKFLTVVTYQSLHAACTNTKIVEEDIIEEEIEEDGNGNEKDTTKDIIKLFKAQNIGTIVVDEAHHLKNAWWQSLTEVKKALNPTIVGLTATPPYDVSHAEWLRYNELNGPVDTEISVPELVVEGDLCPHQDFLMLSTPTKEESDKIDEYRNRISNVYNEVKSDKDLIDALEQHPIYQNPLQNLDWIYTNLEYYSSVLIFLNAVGKEISKKHIEVIGDRKFKVPDLNYEWIETLLIFYLYKDSENFKDFEEHQEKLINKLKRNGAIEKRAINFRHNKKVNSFLSSSISKLASIDEIVNFEHDQLKEDLRLVVLTDYIRKEFLVQGSSNDLELNKIGVLPIFEKLRRTNDRHMKIGVLTGSLIIIPSSALSAFQARASKLGVDEISSSTLPYDSNYLVINANNKIKHDIVHIVTEIFEDGDIEVLIGTKSLLGEGWDAPSINSLILASFVGSYVLSNQMRGRAIRTERKNIDKTSNIWHLVCVDPSTEEGGDDIELLKRRFKAFVGVSLSQEASIENGIGRLNLPVFIQPEEQIAYFNNVMKEEAARRDRLKLKWKSALESGNILIEEIKVPFKGERTYEATKSMYYSKTIKYLFGMLGSGLVAFGFEVLQGLSRAARHIRSMEDFYMWLMLFGGIGVLTFGRLTYKAFRTYIMYRDISKDIHQIGEALLESLIKAGVIHSDYAKLTVVAEIDSSGSIYCHLKGGTTFEKSTFISSLQEIIGVVENPRYVIVRKSIFLNLISQKDYHSVPEMLGRKKPIAEHFERQWTRFVGHCDLVYTRTVEGRKMLLKSRISSLASEFEDKTERINKWR